MRWISFLKELTLCSQKYWQSEEGERKEADSNEGELYHSVLDIVDIKLRWNYMLYFLYLIELISDSVSTPSMRGQLTFCKA